MHVQCKDCGYTGGDDFKRPDGILQCPNCRSSNLQIHVMDTVQGHEKIGLKAYRDGQTRAYRELIQGEELYRREGKWVRKYRLIDREADEYHECVTDPETGQIIHECKEPLSRHRGHGSAKREPNNDTTP